MGIILTFAEYCSQPTAFPTPQLLRISDYSPVNIILLRMFHENLPISDLECQQSNLAMGYLQIQDFYSCVA